MSNPIPNSQNPANSTALNGAVVGEMTLLVVDPAGTCQLVKSTQSKVALGADPSCAVRIEAAGIEPMHCVIARDAEKSVARRWANNTWMNNTAFDEVVVNVGDVIRVGDYQIRVEADERAAVATPAPQPVEQTGPQPQTTSQPQTALPQQEFAPAAAPAAAQPVQATQPTTTQPAAMQPPVPQQPVAPAAPAQQPAAAQYPTQPVAAPQPVQEQPIPQAPVAPAPAAQPADLMAAADPVGQAMSQFAAAGVVTAGAALAVAGEAVAPSPTEPQVSAIAPQQPVAIQPIQPVEQPPAPEQQAPVAPQVQQVSVEQPIIPVAAEPPQQIQQAPVAPPVQPEPQFIPPAVESPVQSPETTPSHIPAEPPVQQPAAEQQVVAATTTPIQPAPVEPVPSAPIEQPAQAVAPQAAPAVEPQAQQATVETQVPAPATVEQPVAAEPTAPVETEPVAETPESNPEVDEIQRQMAELERQRAEIAAEQQRIAEARAELEQQTVSTPAEEEAGSGDAQLDEVYDEIQGIRSEAAIDTAYDEQHVDSEEDALEEDASNEGTEDDEDDYEEAEYDESGEEEFDESENVSDDSGESEDEYGESDESAYEDEESETMTSDQDEVTSESTEQPPEADEDDPFARLQTLANDIPPPPDFDEDPFDRLQRMSSEDATGNTVESVETVEAVETVEDNVPAATAAEDPFEALRESGSETSSFDDDDPFAALQRNLEQASFEPDSSAEDTSPASFDSAPAPVEPPQSVEELIAPQATADEDSQYESATMAALARMGQSLDLEDDPVPPSQNDPMAMGAPTMQNGTTAGPPQTEADDDINDYMAQLLQRVGGGSEAEPTAEATAPAPAAGKAPAATSNNKSAAAAPPQPVAPKKITKLTELPPVKRHAPENTMNLAAMRELANQTNRSAIQSHARKQRKEASSAKFMLSMALVIGSLIVLFIPFFPLLIRSVVGVLMLGVGVFSCLRAMKIDAVGKMQEMFRKN